MSRVVGIRWREADPIIFADAGDLELINKNYVVVRTEKGQELGWVVREPRILVLSQPEEEIPLTVVRKATGSDIGRWQQTKEMDRPPSVWPAPKPANSSWA